MGSVLDVLIIPLRRYNMGNIGQSIGIVDHSFSITNDHGDKVTVSAKVDFSTATDQDIKGWVISNRIIAGQRPWRALSKSELEGLKDQTFLAQNIGRKVKSEEEVMAELEAMAKTNPDRAKELLMKIVALSAEDDKDVE